MSTPARRTRTDVLVEALRARIVSGDLTPGSVVPSESGLVEQFSVSRTVVREAMSRLQATGLVETHHGRGSFVLARLSGRTSAPESGGSLADRIQLLEFRIAVETAAAALAAVRRTGADVSTARRASVALAAAHDRPTEAVSADFRFHGAIAVASGNRHLSDLVDTLGESMIAMPASRLTAEPGAVGLVVAEHEAVLAAVERGDGGAARAAMRVHLANSIARLLARVHPSDAAAPRDRRSPRRDPSRSSTAVPQPVGQPPAKGGSTSRVNPSSSTSSGRAETASTR